MFVGGVGGEQDFTFRIKVRVQDFCRGGGDKQ